MEITPLTFAGLNQRLLERVRSLIRNGELSERQFARLTGISQPHVHNVLKGARALSPELADVILAHLRISPLDLLTREELTIHLNSISSQRESRLLHVPVLSGLLGLHQPIPRKGPHREVHSVPSHLTESVTEPLIVSLAGDPEMEPLFVARDLVLLDQSEDVRGLVAPEHHYVVRTPDGPCVRALDRTGGSLALISEKNKSNPDSWPRIELAGRNILDVVLARVIWLNRRRRWEDHLA